MKLFSLALFVLACMLGSALPSRADIGQWTVHAVFAAPPQKVIDTGSRVYYLSGGSLFAYDKKERETRSYTMSTGLNDPTITDIFYNPAKKYLLVAYSTGNIDLIYDDGKLVNMSDISDSTIEPPLTIRAVAFTDSGILVATSFGLVQFDDTRHEVVQSGNYSANVTAVGQMQGNTLICTGNRLLSVAADKRFPSLSYFTEIAPLPSGASSFLPLDGSRMLAVTGEKSSDLTLLEFDFASTSPVKSRLLASFSSPLRLSKASDNRIYFSANGALYSLNPDNLNLVTEATLPEELDDAVTSTATGASEVWSLTRDGLACHGFGSDGSVTLISDRYKPEQFTVKNVCYLTPSPDKSRLLVTNNGTTVYRFDLPGFEGYNTPLTAAEINLLDEEITDITPYPVEAHLPDALGRQSVVGKYILSPTAIAADPDDPATFYVSSSIDGIYKMTGGKLKGIYNETNSPLFIFDNRNIAYHVSIDRGGNLWLQTTSSATTSTPIFVLPAAKRRLDPDKVTKDDWITLNTKSLGLASGQDVQMLHCTKSNMSFMANHNSAYHFVAFDNRGTLGNFADDKIKVWDRLVDQDGNIFDPSYCSALCEDRDGAVWIGCGRGVFVLNNPSAATNDNMTIRRVKVPKNDGTNTAEYLLGSDLIYSITTDAANRKWIATERSGLFLVSPDGSEILQNFTEENSPLSSNTVYSVYADPNSSTIYVGTAEGLLSYQSDATPAMEDFSEITVFPNPVTPDYSGPIYVKGLMDGSLVKITDSAGSLLYQGRSEGGLFSWDGINSAGARLPSGVYYVFASQNADGSSGGTAKFMIIR